MLTGIQLVIPAALCQELLMVAELDDLTGLNDCDLIAVCKGDIPDIAGRRAALPEEGTARRREYYSCRKHCAEQYPLDVHGIFPFLSRYVLLRSVDLN